MSLYSVPDMVSFSSLYTLDKHGYLTTDMHQLGYKVWFFWIVFSVS